MSGDSLCQLSTEELGTLARTAASENHRLRQALTYIRGSLGNVCEDYAMCSHSGCRDSHAAWEIADWALKDPEMPWHVAWSRPKREEF